VARCEGDPGEQNVTAAAIAAAVTIAALALLLAASSVAATDEPAGSHRGDDGARPDVVLVTVDTLRADRLGAYGGKLVATPSIDRLAGEGTLFENAACPMPMTRPSLAALHTSLHPRESGVVNNGVGLGAGPRTLAEVFAAAGYDTAAFVGVKLLDAGSGLARGFGAYDAPPRGEEQPAEVLVRRAEKWLQGRPSAKPIFLWLHLFDPHLPYAPPPGFAPPPSEGGAHVEAVSWPVLIAAASAHGGDVPASLRDRALGLYAGEVAYVDHWVGELRSALERRGRLDRTILLLTADHGECFDHGIYFEHAGCLYDGAARVPLIVRFPGAVPAGRRLDREVDHLDLAPTLTALAGLERPGGFRGRALFPLAAGDPEHFTVVQHPLYQRRSAVGRTGRREAIRSVGGAPAAEVLIDRPSEALRTREWKLIASGDDVKLYDLRTDPAELADLAKERPETAARLRRELAGWLAANPIRLAAPEAIDPRLYDTLRALGYVE
jgi:arylsulfatase A-like enzyme